MGNLGYTALGLSLAFVAALAQAGGFAQSMGAGMGRGAFMQAQASPGAPAAPGATDRSTGPATAGSRMSAQGQQNTNGPDAADRDTGLSRAEDRASPHAKLPSRKSASRKHKKPTRMD